MSKYSKADLKKAFEAAKQGTIQKIPVQIDQYSVNIEEHFVPNKYPTFEDWFNEQYAKKQPNEILLHFIMGNGGVIELPKVLFRYTYPMAKIKAAYFNEQAADDCEVSAWNEYVDRVRAAVGVDCYCHWVRNKVGDMIGVIAFFDADGAELKVKHFHKWNQLLKSVQELKLK